MSEYSARNYHSPGATEWVVRGTLKMDGGVLVPSSGTQAAPLADVVVSGTYATDDDGIATAINGILAALRGVGIIATA